MAQKIDYNQFSIPQLWIYPIVANGAAIDKEELGKIFAQKIDESLLALQNSCIQDYFEKVIIPSAEEDIEDSWTKAVEVYGDKVYAIQDEIMKMATIFGELLIVKEFVNEVYPEFEFQNYEMFFGILPNNEQANDDDESDDDCSTDCCS